MIISYVPILVLVGTVASQNSECKSLQWVPGYRKKIFTTIFNHVDCPTWTTRNVFTKEATVYTQLFLPRDMPFAFLCGACFSPGSVVTNLTAEINNGQPLAFVPVKRNRNTYEHTKDDYTDCLISYGLTAPLTKGGQIICRFNRGRKVYEEKLTFSVRGTGVSDTEEETKEVPSTGVVRLKCPEEDTELQKKQNVYVWYSAGREDSPLDDISFLVPNMNREIDFRPKEKEHHVACAVYDVMNPSTVYIKRYKVLSSADDIRAGHWVAEEQEVETSSTGTSRGIIIIAGLLGGGIFLTSFLVCASFGLCKCRNKSTAKSEPEAANRLSLLRSNEADTKYVQ